MAGNPMVSQGTLNRVAAALTWTNFPALNVTAPFLGRDMIRLSLDGESTLYIPTATGAVTSPEPYMMITASAHLLKTQGLAKVYQQQMTVTTLLGDGTVYPDVPVGTGIDPYSIFNCSIEAVRELTFNGTDDGWRVSFRGYVIINNDLFN